VREHGSEAPAGEGLLLVDYEGPSQEIVERQAASLAGDMHHLGLNATVADTPEGSAELWEVRHAASPILAALPPETRSLQVVEDGCVPIDRLADYVMLLRNAALSRRMRIVLFGHAGSGHLHANLLADVTRPGFEADLSAILDEVSTGVARLGGTLAGEHGDGRLRSAYLERVYGRDVMELFRLVKACFDPAGILNPGVILPIPGSEGALRALKVGAGAAPIDPDLEAALRAIERGAGYATPRLSLVDVRPPR
jgi:FAD/FMN-containing dehydrogenase